MPRITFKAVQDVFKSKESTIEKLKKARHYMINDTHVYINLKLVDLIALLNEKGVEYLTKEFEYSEAENTKTKTGRKKKVPSGKKQEISKLEEEITGITLQILNLDTTERKTKKHYTLREQLHVIHDQLVQLGARH